MENDLPNLLVIGSMKCGTTSLHHYLNQHPDISMSDIKEINYFIPELNHERSIEWYKNQFNSEIKYRGESSQNYSKRHLFSGVPERIRGILPNVKIIYVLRNPIDRFRSHVNEAISLGNRNKKFDPNKDIIDEIETSNYALTGKYFYQLEPYYKIFEAKNIKVVMLEDIQQTPQIIMNDIFSWLGLSNISSDQINFDQKNSFEEKRIPNFIGRLISDNFMVGNAIKNTPNSIKKLIKSRVRIKKLTSASFESIVIGPELNEKLKEIYINDLLILSSFLEKTKTNMSTLSGINRIIKSYGH